MTIANELEMNILNREKYNANTEMCDLFRLSLAKQMNNFYLQRDPDRLFQHVISDVLTWTVEKVYFHLKITSLYDQVLNLECVRQVFLTGS